MRYYCKNCSHLRAEPPYQKGALRWHFYCNHRNQRYIEEYHKKHRMSKQPNFVCFGTGLYGNKPTIKTSPAWCPLKARGNANR